MYEFECYITETLYNEITAWTCENVPDKPTWRVQEPSSITKQMGLMAEITRQTTLNWPASKTPTRAAFKYIFKFNNDEDAMAFKLRWL